MTDPYARLDAAYALGALDAADAAAYEAHLRTCERCRAEADEARATVALLALSTGSAAESPGEFAAESAGDPWAGSPAVPDTLLPGLLRRAAAERRRRTRFTAALAGLVAACVLALAWLGWNGLRPDPTPAARPVALTAVHSTGIEATAVLTDRSWGTQITVHCRYEHAMAGYHPYRLVVIDDADDADDAGSWQLGPGRSSIDYTAGTAVRRERIAKVQVTLADGTPILQLVL